MNNAGTSQASQEPEPVLVLMLRRLLVHDLMEVAMVKHANAARDEVQHLADETSSWHWPGPRRFRRR